jgi:hypothetical protein
MYWTPGACSFSSSINIEPVRFAGLLWLRVLFAGLLWKKNTAGWLLIWLNQRNEQDDSSLVQNIDVVVRTRDPKKCMSNPEIMWCHGLRIIVGTLWSPRVNYPFRASQFQNTGPVRQTVFLAYKPAVADLLWEKNTVPRLISRADKLSRTGDYLCPRKNTTMGGVSAKVLHVWPNF